MVWGKMASSRVRVSAPAGSGKGMDKLVRYGKVRQDFVAKRRTAIFGLGLLKNFCEFPPSCDAPLLF